MSAVFPNFKYPMTLVDVVSINTVAILCFVQWHFKTEYFKLSVLMPGGPGFSIRTWRDVMCMCALSPVIVCIIVYKTVEEGCSYLFCAKKTATNETKEQSSETIFIKDDAALAADDKSILE